MGEVFGRRAESKKYGWSRFMGKNVRERRINPDGFLDRLILFPPNPKSTFCKKNPKLDCKEAFWKIELENGPYEVADSL